MRGAGCLCASQLSQSLPPPGIGCLCTHWTCCCLLRMLGSPERMCAMWRPCRPCCRRSGSFTTPTWWVPAGAQPACLLHRPLGACCCKDYWAPAAAPSCEAPRPSTLKTGPPLPVAYCLVYTGCSLTASLPLALLLQPKAVGSLPVAERVQQLCPDIHIFGHTHFAWDATIDGEGGGGGGTWMGVLKRSLHAAMCRGEGGQGAGLLSLLQLDDQPTLQPQKLAILGRA